MKQIQLTILIPAYNESRIITDSISKVQRFLRIHMPDITAQIIVVNDGSTDSTKDIVQSLDYVTYLGYEQNKGKGYALRYAMQRIESEFVYLCDADLSVSIDQLSIFWQAKDTASCIIGTRQSAESTVTVSWYRKYLGILGNALINMLLKLNLKDTQCGFKLLDRRAQIIFCTHTTDRWGFDFDFLFRMQRTNTPISEVPVTWIAGEESKMTVFGYITTLIELFRIWQQSK
jgi:glycosyltransferase involved in cell wall biosynthesis